MSSSRAKKKNDRVRKHKLKRKEKQRRAKIHDAKVAREDKQRLHVLRHAHRDVIHITEADKTIHHIEPAKDAPLAEHATDNLPIKLNF